MILFPKTALVFAFFASVLDLVAARTAAARPMDKGLTLLACSEVNGVAGIADSGENAVVEDSSVVNDNKVI